MRVMRPATMRGIPWPRRERGSRRRCEWFPAAVGKGGLGAVLAGVLHVVHVAVVAGVGLVVQVLVRVVHFIPTAPTSICLYAAACVCRLTIFYNGKGEGSVLTVGRTQPHTPSSTLPAVHSQQYTPRCVCTTQYITGRYVHVTHILLPGQSTK